MKDLVPKGTGNSRLLRSSIPADITFAEMVTMLRNGTFPVDFAGLNSAGVAVVGSAYSKANVLPDSVCSKLGIPTSSEPKDAFGNIPKLITDSYNKAMLNFVSGTYVGTGITESQTINLGKKPLFAAVSCENGNVNRYGNSFRIYGDFATCTDRAPTLSEGKIVGISLTNTGFQTVKDPFDSGHGVYTNDEGITYTYFAVLR